MRPAIAHTLKMPATAVGQHGSFTVSSSTFIRQRSDSEGDIKMILGAGDACT